MKTEISYGKLYTTFQRSYAAPLTVSAIPESEFVGRSNIVFAYSVSVEIFGNNFLPAYTQGDNSMLVATDTMKNFILRESAQYEGATLEGLLIFLGHRFLSTYAQMESLELTGQEIPFAEVRVPQEGEFAPSKVLFNQVDSDHATAQIRLERIVPNTENELKDPLDDQTKDQPEDQTSGARVTRHDSGRAGFRLLKITGSSFAAFQRDEYTTLPDYQDRPLLIHMDLGWKYSTLEDLSDGSSNYVAGEQISDLCKTVFHEFNSKSIQELIYVMGQRILERFPQLEQISFDSENHTWDRVAVHPVYEKIKVYWEPKRAYGQLKLVLARA